jgi:hypothetical protein
MSGTRVAQPAVSRLGTGARLCVVVAALLVVAAVVVAFRPLEQPTAAGPPFRCGTALHPTSGALARSVCEGTVAAQQQLAAGFGAAALVVLVGGVWSFGGARRRPSAASVAPAATDDVPGRSSDRGA